MSDVFFSIVIPMYNTVHYLSRCIDSLLSQSCDDFEIILVDDASTDGTGELADKYTLNYSQICVLHISHSGVSAARNIGLKAAVGKYVLFMDSDDTLVPDALKLIKEGLNDCPDMLWFGFRYHMDDGSESEGQKLRDISYRNAAEAATEWIRNDIMPVSACNKVFRLSVIREFKIAFREGFSFGEDRLFNFDYLKHCGKIVMSSHNLYVYTVRDESSSHRFVPGMLSVRLSLHKEKMSALLPLCVESLSDKERQDFSENDYLNCVVSAWRHLAKYYHSITAGERKIELAPYLSIDVPKAPDRKTLGRRINAWLLMLKAAIRFNSLTMLKLMMAINSLVFIR